jgi:photosystem II stability/assembly factor-like uncharacterized protein
MKKILFAFCILHIAFSLKAQQIKILTEGIKTSIRGLSVVNDKVIWASGSNGMVARSANAGNSFEWQQVKGFEKIDFRDIEAFDSNTAIIMGVASPAYILKTKDGGKNWYKVFEDTTKGMFLDAMKFNGSEIEDTNSQIIIKDIDDSTNSNNKIRLERMGIVIGDPINGKPFVAMTDNDGNTWKSFNSDSSMLAIITAFNTGEAFFASSGTNISFINGKYNFLLAVSGGKNSRLIVLPTGLTYSLPIMQGKESTGANSIDINSKTKKGIIVGGDFANDKDTTLNCVLIDFNKKIKFTHTQTPPHGYRSCVIYLDENNLVTCGTSGVDISNDGGNNWQLISAESFHVVQKAKKGNAVFLAGSKGRIAQIIF